MSTGNGMITQGTFAYLPELTDEDIEAQIKYAISEGWALSIELTDDPHPRNLFWEMWGLPMFDLTDSRGAMVEVNACREAFPNQYVKVNCFDHRKGRETVALSFIVQTPPDDPGFRLDRQHGPGRTNHYTLHAYAADKAHGERYG
ncbi:MAG: ribulose bisphosphate carboxylase small subunit [Acidimicrobiales bacterium]